MRERMLGAARFFAVLSRLALWIAAVGHDRDDRHGRLAGLLALRAEREPELDRAASILVMSWFIFLGAAVGVRENFHMGFDVLIHFLPGAGAWMRGDLRPRGARLRRSAWWSTAAS